MSAHQDHQFLNLGVREEERGFGIKEEEWGCESRCLAMRLKRRVKTSLVE